MAWLKVEQSLPNHRKTLKISDELGIPIPNIIGHLVMFWLWGMDSAKDGRLDNITPGMIARVSGWTGDPDAFVSALVSAGFFERDDDGMRIRNWERYAGRLIEKREEDAKRKRRYREKERVSGQRADGDESEIVTSVGRPQDIRSPSDVERKKERKKERNKDLSCSSGDERASEKVLPPQEVKKILDKSFEEFWGFYPRKTAKADARKAFNSVLKAAPTQKKKAEMLDSIAAHLGKYLEEIEARQTEEKYIAYPGTWLRATDFSEPPSGSGEEGPAFVRCEDV